MTAGLVRMQGARDNSIELGAFRSWPRPSDISEFLDHTQLGYHSLHRTT
jgi:hypothetical protein